MIKTSYYCNARIRAMGEDLIPDSSLGVARVKQTPRGFVVRHYGFNENGVMINPDLIDDGFPKASEILGLS